MSALYVDSSATWVPLAVLLASLAGSGHCVAMCGGLVSAMARTRSAWIGYHLGRLGGYLSLGALAGWLGGALFRLTVFSWVAAALLGISFVLAGFRVWQGKNLHLTLIPASWHARLFKLGGNKAWAAGLLTAILPCGWLHTFVLGAVATRTPLMGAAFLLVFWLGTLPALGLTPWLVDRVFRPFSRRSPRIAALILIAAGAMSVGIKIAPLATEPPPGTTPGEVHHCH